MTGMCQLCQANVSSIWPDVSTFRANVSSFWPNVFTFEGNVSTLAGDVFSFRRCALVGDGARTEGEIPRLRCAALGMTTAAGGGALGLRAWTGWQVALGLIMALGHGRGRRDDGGGGT